VEILVASTCSRLRAGAWHATMPLRMYFLDSRFLAFVPLLCAVYWLVGLGRRGGSELTAWSPQNLVLLAGNIAWLCVFSPQTLVALTALTIVVVYPVARLAGALHGRGEARRAARVAWLGIAVVIAVATVLRLPSVFLRGLALSSSPMASELLRWIGFSYFLLKAIHVMLGTARGIFAAPTLVGLVQYALFLPTLSSGPIYRLDVFSQQLAAPKRLGWADVHDGGLRILVGLAKKVVAVPLLSSLSVSLHARGLAMQPAAYVATYAMLFLDFSGYSDIAIGLGRLFGFAVPENFKHVFTSTTLTQFWRNWHATLGDWLRETVFIPLGGMRARGWQLSAIVVGSMLVVGVWHGYRWIFLGWGLFHGVMLLVENRLGVKPLRAHRTPWWRLGLRYALVQAVVIAGMFAFIGGLSP